MAAGIAPASCPNGKRDCTEWVQTYFSDCLCTPKDQISFALGFVSLLCWGAAEFPQIITNFYTKSCHGVSLAFLLTWVAGDAFNLVGCLLEPATLPTQFYTALVYTCTTVVLVLQTLYYDWFYKWWKSGSLRLPSEMGDAAMPLVSNTGETGSKVETSPVKISTPGVVYFMSARSLASSGTPSFGTDPCPAASGPSALWVDDDDSDDEESPAHSNQPHHRSTLSHSIRCGVISSAIIFPYQAKASIDRHLMSSWELLQDNHEKYGNCGVWLGWTMAAIYVGGRFPQIWLNIKRGSIEGLNPLMFVLALIANATYVGSILLRTTKWDKIKSNMPWLLDAALCVLLDMFIIMQFLYFRYLKNFMIQSGLIQK